MMKKTRLLLLGALFAGTALFVGNNIYASKDPDKVLEVNKVNHQKTLHALGIDVNKNDLKNLGILTDKEGEKWIYNAFTQRRLIVDKIEKKYSEEVKTSFIEMQDELMQKYAKKGDTVPVILLDEDLKEGSFSFTRENGDIVSFKLKYDEKEEKWNYKK